MSGKYSDTLILMLTEFIKSQDSTGSFARGSLLLITTACSASYHQRPCEKRKTRAHDEWDEFQALNFQLLATPDYQAVLMKVRKCTNWWHPCRQFCQNLLHARFVTVFQSVTASLGRSDVIFDRVASNCHLLNGGSTVLCPALSGTPSVNQIPLSNSRF